MSLFMYDQSSTGLRSRELSCHLKTFTCLSASHYMNSCGRVPCLAWKNFLHQFCKIHHVVMKNSMLRSPFSDALMKYMKSSLSISPWKEPQIMTEGGFDSQMKPTRVRDTCVSVCLTSLCPTKRLTIALHNLSSLFNGKILAFPIKVNARYTILWVSRGLQAEKKCNFRFLEGILDGW